MYGITNMGGGTGLNLNFTVVGGTTEPISPVLNTIWVHTDTEISGYIFSPTEPENPTEGLIWIQTDSGSGCAFNIIKKNQIWTYPVVVYQYITDTFIKQTAQIYQNGWRDVSYEIYWLIKDGKIIDTTHYEKYLPSSATEYEECEYDNQIDIHAFGHGDDIELETDDSNMSINVKTTTKTQWGSAVCRVSLVGGTTYYFEVTITKTSGRATFGLQSTDYHALSIQDNLSNGTHIIEYTPSSDMDALLSLYCTYSSTAATGNVTYSDIYFSDKPRGIKTTDKYYQLHVPELGSTFSTGLFRVTIPTDYNYVVFDGAARGYTNTNQKCPYVGFVDSPKSGNNYSTFSGGIQLTAASATTNIYNPIRAKYAGKITPGTEYKLGFQFAGTANGNSVGDVAICNFYLTKEPIDIGSDTWKRVEVIS